MKKPSLFLALVLPLTAWGSEFVREQVMMGDVPVSITVAAPAPEKMRALTAMGEAFEEARRIERLVSEFRPTSETSLLNRNAGRSALQISRELMEILSLAAKVSRATSGAFDITFASPDRSATWRGVILDRRRRTAFLKKGTRIGLSGIAKGYIVDRMAAVLQRGGFKNFLVNAGGDLIAFGENRGKPWSVGLTNPERPRGPPLCYLLLKNQAAATSGSYERGPHIIDPQTRKPTTPLRSATAVAPNAALADGMATGLYVLGEKGTEAATKAGLDGAILVTRSGTILTESVNGRRMTDCREVGRGRSL